MTRLVIILANLLLIKEYLLLLRKLLVQFAVHKVQNVQIIMQFVNKHNYDFFKQYTMIAMPSVGKPGEMYSTLSTVMMQMLSMS